jgi:hypothetical protein
MKAIFIFHAGQACIFDDIKFSVFHKVSFLGKFFLVKTEIMCFKLVKRRDSHFQLNFLKKLIYTFNVNQNLNRQFYC